MVNMIPSVATSRRPIIPLNTYDLLHDATDGQDGENVQRCRVPGFARPRRFRKTYFIAFLALLIFIFRRHLDILRRDIGYLTRPLWDRKPERWDTIERFAPPGSGELVDLDVRRRWCGLHGWDARPGQNGSVNVGSPGVPEVYDAIMVNTEIDMLEIRIRELLPYVDKLLVVESTRTLSGRRKRTYFEENKERFRFAMDKIVHRVIDDLTPDTPPGDFSNEAYTRRRIGEMLAEDIRPSIGSLVLQSDVDEVISRDTLRLLKTCQGYPSSLHLNVKNYLYSFEFPLLDAGYWRPKVVTVTTEDNPIAYTHGRAGSTLLMDAGWHCSWCFRTLTEFRIKMLGYSHNDRMTSNKLLESDVLQRKICNGEEPFGMFPEAYTFRDLIIQSGPIPPATSYVDIPIAVRQDPDMYSFLVKGGCKREEGEEA